MAIGGKVHQSFRYSIIVHVVEFFHVLFSQ